MSHLASATPDGMAFHPPPHCPVEGLSVEGYAPESFNCNLGSQQVGAATRTMASAGSTFEASTSQTSPMSQSVDQPANMPAHNWPILGLCIFADGANSSLNEHNG